VLAVPPHLGKLHSIASRTIHRNDSLIESSDMMNIAPLAEMAARRHASRSSSLIKQLPAPRRHPAMDPLSAGTRARKTSVSLDTARQLARPWESL